MKMNEVLQITLKEDSDETNSVNETADEANRSQEKWQPSIKLLDSIIKEPQKYFSKFLYESNILETFELLSALILYCPENGHSVAIECLWCWQDLMGGVEKCPFGLSPIVDELEQTNCLNVACAALRLIIQLCKMAPNAVSRIRLRHELNELHVDEFVGCLREKFEWNCELNELIAEWMITRNNNSTDNDSVNNKDKQNRASVNNKSFIGEEDSAEENSHSNLIEIVVARADADSGTFSGEEEDNMSREDDSDLCSPSSSTNSMINQSEIKKSLSKSVKELVKFLTSEKFAPYSEIIAHNLIEILRELSTPPSTPTTTTTTFSATNDTSKTTSDCNKLQSYGKILDQFCQFLKQQRLGSESTKSVPPIAPPLILLNSKCSKSPPPPPPPPLSIKPPPPPPIFGIKSSNTKAPSKLGNASSSNTTSNDIPKALRPKCVPPEGKKLRHLQWTKIPLQLATNKVTANYTIENAQTNAEELSVWQNMDQIDMCLKDKLDYSGLDKYFCCNENMASLPMMHKHQADSTNSLQDNKLSPNHSQSSLSTSPLQSKTIQISLISGKRSLSVNIFLKMCKDVEHLVENLKHSKAEAIGLERLKMLVQLLPTEEEQKILRHYTGDMNALGQAEKFLLQLMCIPDFKLRIEAMTLCQEFHTIIADIEPDLDTLMNVCQGNYLNHGAAVGNAVGFKLNSLWKINEIRATVGMRKSAPRTLLHFIAQQLDNCADEFEQELAHVPDAAKISYESLRSDINGLMQRIKSFKNSLNDKADDEFFAEFKTFIEESEERLIASAKRMAVIETLRAGLAIYFCEEKKTFSMEECFKIFCAFIQAFKTACNENINSLKKEANEKSASSLTLLGGSMIRSSTSSLNIPSSTERKGAINDNDPLRNFFNNLTPPSTRRLRHSIHAPSLLTNNFGGSTSELSTAFESLDASFATTSRRTSVIVLEQDRDRQTQLSAMLNETNKAKESTISGIVRRRASHSSARISGDELSIEANSTIVFKKEETTEKKLQRKSMSKLPPINDDELTQKNNLETFVDKALEINQKHIDSHYGRKRYSNKFDATRKSNEAVNCEKRKGRESPCPEICLNDVNDNAITTTIVTENNSINDTLVNSSSTANEIRAQVENSVTNGHLNNHCILNIPITSPSTDNSPSQHSNLQNANVGKIVVSNSGARPSKQVAPIPARNLNNNKACKKNPKANPASTNIVYNATKSEQPQSQPTSPISRVTSAATRSSLYRVRARQINSTDEKMETDRGQQPEFMHAFNVKQNLQRQISVNRSSTEAQGLPQRTKSSDMTSTKILSNKHTRIHEAEKAAKPTKISEPSASIKNPLKVVKAIKRAESNLMVTAKDKITKKIEFAEKRQNTTSAKRLLHTENECQINSRQLVCTKPPSTAGAGGNQHNCKISVDRTIETSTTPIKSVLTKKPTETRPIKPVRSFSTPQPTKNYVLPAAKIVPSTTPNKPTALTAAERRQLMMKPNQSVSTASRPSLIKTGSTSSERSKPRWI